jgi:hypothetical protein
LALPSPIANAKKKAIVSTMFTVATPPRPVSRSVRSRSPSGCAERYSLRKRPLTPPFRRARAHSRLRSHRSMRCGHTNLERAGLLRGLKMLLWLRSIWRRRVRGAPARVSSSRRRFAQRCFDWLDRRLRRGEETETVTSAKAAQLKGLDECNRWELAAARRRGREVPEGSTQPTSAASGRTLRESTRGQSR